MYPLPHPTTKPVIHTLTPSPKGFDPVYRDTREPLPDRLKPLLAECWASFELLRAHALRPDAAPGPAAPLQLAAPGPPNRSASISGSAPPAGAGAGGGGGGGGGAAAGDKAVGGVSGGSHAHAGDARNADVLVGVRDGVLDSFDLLWRPQAKVSVLDSGFMLGDGVWEGLRVHRGVVVFAAQHLERLWEGAAALDMDLGVSQRQLLALVYQVLEANGMGSATGVHIRLMVTRGLKSTPYQDPRVTVGRPTIVILPEWKDPPAEGEGGPRERGLRLFTAAKAGADEALMLDPHGFVATCNSTNFIIVRRGEPTLAPCPAGPFIL
ncbi:branched-chain amino acidaminotransferase [Monoraphidium neglectum]|uniref:Branched-chain amino acidaminotransferase n=1 Tax=Monoraphidium neglectum TaxID=145388 RepID=A0A0D2LUJ1_9CHLO|nr:branched-chain amino acidaminotransferase [Monoraphidium neglectum]KIY93266.1 branched-chain amino acidaminotransferase [Monoraphidium neglectum]|eukprot:XP_013892286.1 branched-chain amino acidaminotransferase [Monoraphidium neglectum]